MIGRKLSLVLAGSVALLASQPALAGSIWIHDSSGDLATVDVDTGAVSMVGTMSTVMTDIAFDSGGQLWAVSFSDLYKVDKLTAATSLVGSLGMFGSNALVFGPGGTLYMSSFGSGDLFSVNTGSGLATSLGNTGFSSAGDLAFNGGELYLAATTDELVRIDLGTVTGAAVGAFGYSNVYGLATDSTGILYGVSGTTIFSVDTLTGAGTFKSDYAPGPLGAANGSSFFGEAAFVPVPAAAPLGLMLLGGLAASRTMRRRRRA